MFKKCNPPDFNLYFGKLYGVPVVLILSLFTAINYTKKQRKKKPKINITSYGENLY